MFERSILCGAMIVLSSNGYMPRQICRLLKGNMERESEGEIYVEVVGNTCMSSQASELGRGWAPKASGKVRSSSLARPRASKTSAAWHSISGHPRTCFQRFLIISAIFELTWSAVPSSAQHSPVVIARKEESSTWISVSEEHKAKGSVWISYYDLRRRETLMLPKYLSTRPSIPCYDKEI